MNSSKAGQFRFRAEINEMMYLISETLFPAVSFTTNELPASNLNVRRSVELLSRKTPTTLLMFLEQLKGTDHFPVLTTIKIAQSGVSSLTKSSLVE